MRKITLRTPNTMSLFLSDLQTHAHPKHIHKQFTTQNIDFSYTQFSPLYSHLGNPFFDVRLHCVRFWIFSYFSNEKIEFEKNYSKKLLVVMTGVRLFMLNVFRLFVNNSKGLWFSYKEMLPYVTDSWYLILMLISKINFFYVKYLVK